MDKSKKSSAKFSNCVILHYHISAKAIQQIQRSVAVLVKNIKMMTFNTDENSFEKAIESWPKWNSNPALHFIQRH